MPGWSGKSKGGALGYRFFIVLIRHTSLSLTYFFIRIVAFYYLLFFNERQHPLLFQECPRLWANADSEKYLC